MKFKGQRFTVENYNKASIERLVKNWLCAFNLHDSITFEVRDLYYHYFDIVPVMSGFIMRFIRLQLQSGERDGVVITSRFMYETYRRFVDFYRGESCEGVTDSYRNRPNK